MWIDRYVYGSIWGRVFAPIALIGVNGFSLNILAWDATRSGKFDLNALFVSPFLWTYLISATVLTLFEFGRAKREREGDDYGRRIMNALQPDLQNHCKDLIKQGKIEEVYQHVNKARSAYNAKGRKNG